MALYLSCNRSLGKIAFFSIHWLAFGHLKGAKVIKSKQAVHRKTSESPTMQYYEQGKPLHCKRDTAQKTITEKQEWNWPGSCHKKELCSLLNSSLDCPHQLQLRSSQTAVAKMRWQHSQWSNKPMSILYSRCAHTTLTPWLSCKLLTYLPPTRCIEGQ